MVAKQKKNLSCCLILIPLLALNLLAFEGNEILYVNRLGCVVGQPIRLLALKSESR